MAGVWGVARGVLVAERVDDSGQTGGLSLGACVAPAAATAPAAAAPPAAGPAAPTAPAGPHAVPAPRPRTWPRPPAGRTLGEGWPGWEDGRGLQPAAQPHLAHALHLLRAELQAQGGSLHPLLLQPQLLPLALHGLPLGRQLLLLGPELAGLDLELRLLLETAQAWPTYRLRLCQARARILGPPSPRGD